MTNRDMTERSTASEAVTQATGEGNGEHLGTLPLLHVTREGTTQSERLMRRQPVRNRNVWTVIMLIGASMCGQAQWLNHPSPGTPRTKDGKPDLSARAPRAANGKPDLSGVWQ